MYGGWDLADNNHAATRSANLSILPDINATTLQSPPAHSPPSSALPLQARLRGLEPDPMGRPVLDLAGAPTLSIHLTGPTCQLLISPPHQQSKKIILEIFI